MQVEDRICNRLVFFGINQTVQDDIVSIWKLVRPKIPEVLTRFYEHLHKVPELSEMIGTRQSYLVKRQSEHWERLFSGRFNEEYVDGIRRIGRAHHKIGLEPGWYIGAYAFVQEELLRHLAEKYRFRGMALARKASAINKAVMLDMDFAISVYQEILIEDRRRQHGGGRPLDRAIGRFGEHSIGGIRSRHRRAQPTRSADPAAAAGYRHLPCYRQFGLTGMPGNSKLRGSSAAPVF